MIVCVGGRLAGFSGRKNSGLGFVEPPLELIEHRLSATLTNAGSLTVWLLLDASFDGVQRVEEAQRLDGDALTPTRFDGIGLERIDELTPRMDHAQHTGGLL